MSVFFIGGIDTDIGKTYATGMLANALYWHGVQVITQKLVQTGCEGIAEDIFTHRQLMSIPLQPVDIEGTTCPYVFSKPASPHLSSALENVTIDPKRITAATNTLSQQYEVILLEGAGGLMVPITESLLTLDYVASQGYPVILVTSGRLGSINHTLLSIEAIQSRHLTLHSVVYNRWQPHKTQTTYAKDDEIVDSTKRYLKNYLKINHPQTLWIELSDATKLDSTHNHANSTNLSDDALNTSHNLLTSVNAFIDTLT